MGRIFEARFVVVGMTVIVLVAVFVRMPMIVLVFMFGRMGVLMPMCLVPMVVGIVPVRMTTGLVLVSMCIMGMTMLLFVMLVLVSVRMPAFVFVLMFVSHLGILFFLPLVLPGLPFRNMHSRDTESAEFGKSLNQNSLLRASAVKFPRS